MELRVKPVYVLDRGQAMLYSPEGRLNLIPDGDELSSIIGKLKRELHDSLQCSATFMEDITVRSEGDLAKLKIEAADADALLVYVMGALPLKPMMGWGVPIIGFSGLNLPSPALYAFGVSQHEYDNVSIALDYQDIDNALKVLEARKKLQNSRIILLGYPPPIYSRWHHLPDFETARDVLGVDFTTMETREFAAELPGISAAEAEALAAKWMQEAKEVIEPSREDIIAVAAQYIALSRLLEKKRANALSINCMEWMYNLNITPPCYAMARLMDEGKYIACESDLIALLSMMTLGFLVDAPALMGNLVVADPVTDEILVSHCVTPTKMAGFGAEARPFSLRDSHHMEHGVNAYVELETGTEVTVARFSRTLDAITVAPGEVVGCRDTVACRTTPVIRVSDARQLIKATCGNHQAVVYGDVVEEVEALGDILGFEAIVV